MKEPAKSGKSAKKRAAKAVIGARDRHEGEANRGRTCGGGPEAVVGKAVAGTGCHGCTKNFLWAPQGAQNSLCERQLTPAFVTRKESRQLWESRFARAPQAFSISEGPVLGPSGRQFIGKRVEN